MRKLIVILCLSLLSSLSSAQTGTAAKKPATTPSAQKPATTAKKPATTAKKPASAAKPAAKATATPASGDPVAIFDTTAGKLTCTLFPKEAPKTVDNFIGLATGKKQWIHPKTGATMTGTPLYDGVIFHRVIPNFMIQGGDPIGTGSGGPGYRFENENVPELLFDRPGRLAMANAGRDTNGSQFFITEVPYPSLNGGYTIFGQCDDASVALVKQIARAATDPRNNRPDQPVTINHIDIGFVPFEGKTHPATPAKPAVKKPATPAMPGGKPAAKPATKKAPAKAAPSASPTKK